MKVLCPTIAITKVNSFALSHHESYEVNLLPTTRLTSNCGRQLRATVQLLQHGLRAGGSGGVEEEAARADHRLAAVLDFEAGARRWPRLHDEENTGKVVALAEGLS
jgi:hypothetical protein